MMLLLRKGNLPRSADGTVDKSVDNLRHAFFGAGGVRKAVVDNNFAVVARAA